MPEVLVIAHNIRSIHNVGSIFRTAEGFGVTKIICSGYTPYPRALDDKRLPHLTEKITKQIHKTALGAEEMVPFEHVDIPDIDKLRKDGYRIIGLEQDKRSLMLHDYQAPNKIALILGEEVHGIEPYILDQCDDLLEIAMTGKKESFNVSVATGIALYQLSRPATSEPHNLRQVA